MGNDWIDAEGFRANVGIILANGNGKLLLGGRVGRKGWQFPQGGIFVGEDPVDAMYRELREEIGLQREDVELLGVTQDWIRYRLPGKYIRRNSVPLCIGQKQKWFLLSLESDDDKVELSNTTNPEFDDWRWVNYWYPIHQVIEFKRDVYRKALQELSGPLNSYIKQQ